MLDKLVKTLLVASLTSSCAEGVMDEESLKTNCVAPTENECSYRVHALLLEDQFVTQVGTRTDEAVLVHSFSDDYSTFQVSYIKGNEGDAFTSHSGKVAEMFNDTRLYFGEVSFQGEMPKVFAYVVDNGVEWEEININVSGKKTSLSKKLNFDSNCVDREYDVEVFRQGEQIEGPVYGPGVRISTEDASSYLTSLPSFAREGSVAPFSYGSVQDSRFVEYNKDSILVLEFTSDDEHTNMLGYIFKDILYCDL